MPCSYRKHRFTDVFCDRLAEWTQQWICDYRSQMFGAKKFDRMRHYVAMSIYLMAAFSIVMTIGFSLANKPILHLMNSPEEVFGDVTAYMGIIYAGLIITGAYNALAAFLRALGDSKSPLYFLIISAVINVILDVVFIVVFGMGVEGCGYAQ